VATTASFGREGSPVFRRRLFYFRGGKDWEKMQRSGHRESKQVKLLQQFGGGCSRENNCTWKNRSPVLGAHIPASIQCSNNW